MTPVTGMQSTPGSEKEISNMNVVVQQHEAEALCAAAPEMVRTDSGSNTAALNNNYTCDEKNTKNFEKKFNGEGEGMECGPHLNHSDVEPRMMETLSHENYLFSTFSLNKAKEEEEKDEVGGYGLTSMAKNSHVEGWLQETLEPCQSSSADHFHTEGTGSTQLTSSNSETNQSVASEVQHCCGTTHEYAVNEESVQLIDGLENSSNDYGEEESPSVQDNEGSITQPNDASKVGIFYRLSLKFKASTLTRKVFEWSRNVCTAAKLQSSENAVLPNVTVPNGPNEGHGNQAVSIRNSQELARNVLQLRTATRPPGSPLRGNAGTAPRTPQATNPFERRFRPSHRRRKSLRRKVLKSNFRKRRAEVGRILSELAEAAESAAESAVETESPPAIESTSDGESETPSEVVENEANVAEPETSNVAVEQVQPETEAEPEQALAILVEGYDGFCQQSLRDVSEDTNDSCADDLRAKESTTKPKPVEAYQFCDEAGDSGLLERLFPSEFFSEVLKEETSIFEDAYDSGSSHCQLVSNILDGNFEPIEDLIDSEEDELVEGDTFSSSGCMSTNGFGFENNSLFVRRQFEYGTKGKSMAWWNVPCDPKSAKYREATTIRLKDVLISDDHEKFFEDAVVDFNEGNYLRAALELQKAVRLTARPDKALIVLANRALLGSGNLPERRKKLMFADNLCTSDQDSPPAYRSGHISRPLLKRTRGDYTGDAVPIKRYPKPLDEAGLKAFGEDLKARLLYCMAEVVALGKGRKLADLDEACKRYNNCYKFFRDLGDKFRAEVQEFTYYTIRVRIDISSAMASMKACGDKVTKLADFINTSYCSLETIEEVSNQGESILQSLHMSDPLVGYMQDAIKQSRIEDEKAMERLKATSELFQRYAGDLSAIHNHFLRNTLRASVDVEKVKTLTGHREHSLAIRQPGLIPQTPEVSQRYFSRFQERVDEIQELKGDIRSFTLDVLSRLDNFRREIGVL
ncbi:hypothetical protein OY671_000684 [Metschnikowia pulcherrima]|nr:hypothetical protein OY671_000684 [Metschnikowia pulcherrima]